MKKGLWIVLAYLFSSILLLVSCTGETKNPSSSTLTLLDERVTLTLLEEYALLADYDGEEDIVWSSSDLEVVTVNENGKVIGKKEGNAIITAMAGDAKDTCEIVVDGYLIDLLEVVFFSPQMIFYEGETRESGATLQFANEPLTVECTKSFVSNNPDVAIVDNDGKITAVRVGETTITATFTVKGQIVSGTLIVNVQRLGRVEITQDMAMLYVYDEGTYGDSVELSAKVYDKGILVSNSLIVWSVDTQDVISVSETGIVTALKPGTAVVTAMYSSEETEYIDNISITVLEYIRIDNELIIAKNRITNGYSVDIANLTGNNKSTLVSAKIKTVEGELISLSIEGETIYFDSSIKSGNAALILETDANAYELSLAIFDVSIKDVQEFKAYFSEDAGLWYCLEADIDFSNIELWGGENQRSVFSGVFDGRGYSIKGLTVAVNGGLFKELNGGYIKNLNIIDAVVGNSAGVVAYNVQGDENIIENVYVSVKDYGDTQIGGVFSTIAGGLEVKNSCVYLPETFNDGIGLIGGCIDYPVMINNCVLIGGNQQVAGNKAGLSNTPPGLDNTTICSALEAHKVHKEKLNALGLYNAYSTNHPYLALSNSNFTKETFDSLTTEIVELTEDITPKELELEAKRFYGVFEGNGNSITGLKLSGKPLFGNLTGATIRNVVIVDAQLTTQNQGVLAYATIGQASNIFDNIYVSIKEVKKGGNGTGALIDRGWAPMVFKDVVVYVYASLNSITDISFLQGSNCATTITTTNCTFIGPLNYTKYGTNDSKIILDENTGKYRKNDITEDILAKMSDQNYEAYTGTPRVPTDDSSGDGNNENNGGTGDNSGTGNNGNVSGGGEDGWSPVVPFD